MDQNEQPEKGTLLLAEPFLWDPNFKRTVTLICDHEQNKGSFGFVLNRKLDMSLHEAVPGINKFNAPLYYGGPVEIDTLHYIHNIGKELTDAIKICEGLFWGGDFKQLKKIINSGKAKPDNFRFFIGYSGWEAQQLQQEINEKSWILHQINSYHIFDVKSEDLWKVILEEKGGEFAQMINYPEDPSLN